MNTENKCCLDADIVKRCLTNTQQITFEVTERCNLTCHYCAYGSLYSEKRNSNCKDLRFETIVLFFKYMKQLWNTEYNDSFCRDLGVSFYGGEPLLNIDLIKNTISFIEIELDNVGRNFMFSMTTNGLLLKKHIDYLVEKNFNILVSLDGDEDESSYRIRANGQTCYYQLVQDLNDIRKKYPSFYENNINFNAVLHNKNSVESIHRYFSTVWNKIPMISELNAYGVRKDKEEEFNLMFKNTEKSLTITKNCSVIERDMKANVPTYKSAVQFLQNYSEFSYYDYNELLYGKDIRQTTPTGTCLPFAKKVFITASGDILPCERIDHKYSLGKIANNLVDLNFSRIADLYNHYYESVEQICKKCYAQKGCSQCMFYIKDFDAQGSHMNCGSFLNKEQFLIYKNRQLELLNSSVKCNLLFLQI